MNLDLDTLQSIRHYIKKQIEKTKEDLVYHVDTIDNLSYSRGKLSALETLLQDIKNLHKEDNDGTIDKT